jgi:hypothetical protein
MTRGHMDLELAITYEALSRYFFTGDFSATTLPL